MKRLFIIYYLLFIAISCDSQVPSVGGFQKPGVTESGGGSYDPTEPGWAYANGFDISEYSSVSNAFDFSEDGTKMFVVDIVTDDVSEWSMSTAWDITTLEYVQSFDISNETGYPGDIDISPNGNNLYLSTYSTSGGDAIWQYSLPTAWSLTGASYSKEYDTSSDMENAYGMFFNDDGDNFYIHQSHVNYIGIIEFSLSTSWDIESAAVVDSSTAQSGGWTGVSPSPDGNYIYAHEFSSTIKVYPLSTQYDWQSYDYDTYTQINCSPYPTNGAQDIFMHPDGDAFYIISNSDDYVYKWIKE